MGGFMDDPVRRARVNRKMNQKWRLPVMLSLCTGGFAIGAYNAISGLIDLAASNAVAPTTFAYVASALIAFAVGFVAFFFREIIKLKIYPLIEIGVGMGAASLFVRPGEAHIARVLLLLAGVRVIVDGIKRFREFNAPSEKIPESAA